MNEKIKLIMAENLGIDADDITDDALLVDFEMDSLQIALIANAIEDEFDIDFPTDDFFDMLVNFSTVGGFISDIERRVQG